MQQFGDNTATERAEFSPKKGLAWKGRFGVEFFQHYSKGPSDSEYKKQN
jgi:hypothetical protein